MSEPFLSEIKMCAFNFAPTGWTTCDGQLMQIQQNQALYALIGITYGGNGTTTFQIPDLRGRVPLQFSASYTLGISSGNENVTLLANQTPGHIHALQANSAVATVQTPGGNMLAQSLSGYQAYTDVANLVPMNGGCISSVGGTGHSNVQPTLVVNFIIAISGIWPSRE